jgi:two-component system cell cycle sensor histidine kinase/response regulator CckA
MNQDTPPDERAASLRQRAEEQARVEETRELAALSPEETRRLLHELRVHQIELEMQNEELRRAQLELEASRARYFDLYDLAPVGYLSVSQKGLILEANLTAAALLGVARAALARQALSCHILPEDQDIYYRHRKQLSDTGEPQVCELRLVGGDGQPFWARLEATLAHETERDAPVCRVVISDITARKRAEREREQLLAQVREQARRVQTILDTVPEGVLLLDAGQRVLLANPAAQEALALLAEAGPDQPLARLGGRPLAELLAPSRGLRHEVRAGGRTFEVLAHAIQDGPGSERWVLALADVTQEREVRARLEEQQRLAAVGQLAAGVAHDFNNLMAAITLSTQMLQRNLTLSEKDAHYLDVIRDRVAYATRLIGQILDFGRRSYLKRAPLDLLPLLQELLASLESSLPANVRLELSADRDEYLVLGDAARLQQAILNLAANARDAMPGGGRLQFALSLLAGAPDAPPPLPDLAAGDWVRLAVSDSGVGIAPEILPFIFEPFFTTKEPGQGSGLGLAQVHGLVKLHGGAVTAHSQPGQGTTLNIYLPLLAAPVLEAGQPPGARPAPDEAETILLVEDEPCLRQVIVETLQELGYRVLTAVSGAEALARLEQGQAIDLLLGDLALPGLNGLDLCRALHQQRPATQCLFMTGTPPPGADRQALQQEGIGWLLKPFDLDELAGSVQALLAQATPTGRRSRWRREQL